MCFKLTMKDMGIDLGTANTLVYIKDKGIVLNEPSVVSKDNVNNKIIAVGSEAKAMLGKTPDNITVIRPLQDGVISDFDMTAEMLRVFISKALAGKRATNLRVVIGVPSGVTEVEKRAVEEVVRQIGAKDVYIMEEPMAAAIGSGLQVDQPNGCMIADIGGGTADIAVIALGGIVASTSLRHAGDRFNEAIVQYMRKQYNLLIGEQTAEELKIGIGCALVSVSEDEFKIETTMNARGRDLVSGLPRAIPITSKDIFYAVQESVELIIDSLKATIEKAPPEIAADIVINGMVLSGGGGMLKNLDKLIEERTGLSVVTAENAFEAVAIGTGKSLANISKLKHYAGSKKDKK